MALTGFVAEDEVSMVKVCIDAVHGSHALVTLHNQADNQLSSVTLTWEQVMATVETPGEVWWPGDGQEGTTTMRIWIWEPGQGPNKTDDRMVMFGDTRWTANGAHLGVWFPVWALRDYLAELL